MLIHRISTLLFCTRHKSVYTSTLNNPRFPFTMYPQHNETSATNTRWNCFYYHQLNNPNHHKFIIHDGPPYANGELHAGHALNKVLKDVLLRFKLLSGHSVEYVPGWDCHGLPIELKATENLNLSSPEDTRKLSSLLANKFVEIQKSSFQDLGIIGSWNENYSTMDKCFEATELKAFSDLYSKGFIFRGLLPVYWSTCTKSAIAESELEYNPEHKSCSVYLKVSLTRCNHRVVEKLSNNCNVYAIIWTTNPWTIFSNEAVAYDSDVKLYFNNPNDPCRRNTQTVFWLTVECLKALLAPILPYLMEEVESVTWNLLSTQLNDFSQSTTLLERYSSLSLHEYCSIDKSKPCSDWILCLLAMSQWDKFKDDLSYVNSASSLFHSLINLLPKDRNYIPSTNPLSNAHVHIIIPAKCQESYHMLKVLHPLESYISVSSDLCYILRAASTSWSFEPYKEGVLSSSAYHTFTINDMQVSVTFPLGNQTVKCQRCHRYTDNGVEKPLCPRCMQVISSSLAVKL
ncbi:hypothetical protein MN116_006951 [Schistosoma mekongi]|uniref:isoleucine--tRNA ligase n=1 Tax=Schistosoma mekongi TaxID=38744 RepID=A0AAE1Z916_SCHME|nr:hypothetical protein MN116_006951 [Schistosoma mekongi]